jgi:hypothetical protein
MKKAYQISAYDVESMELVFAETPGKAKAIAIDYNYDLADEGYVNLTATRKKKFDQYLPLTVNDRFDWSNQEHQKILKEHGWHEID